MRISDHIEQSFSNLWKKKLRTFLTTFGVVIGIGALVSMFAFGQGMQDNITKRFKELDLLNYISVYSAGTERENFRHHDGPPRSMNQQKPKQTAVLDEEILKKIRQIRGVEWAFAEIRFPAMIRFNNQEKFTFIQALPAAACKSSLMRLQTGKPFDNNNTDVLIISDSMLRSMDVNDPQKAIGKQVEVSTLTIDPNNLNPALIQSIISGAGTPFARESYPFTIVGITGQSDFGGPSLLRSEVFIPIEASEKMKKLSATNIQDFFAPEGGRQGYSMASVKASSIDKIDSVKQEIEKLGLNTFAFADNLKEMKIGFMLMDMFLFGIGMIAITVACLGIINTMVMSIMERYHEIGIMKAIGAGDGDVKKIIFFESATIGFLGGVFGLALGWSVSMVINRVINHFMSGRGLPYIECFSFPWWLCLGAIAFATLISLIAGVYPAIRAAKVDPVVALRHD
jgi:putative ABC transport system permease protein